MTRSRRACRRAGARRGEIGGGDGLFARYWLQRERCAHAQTDLKKTGGDGRAGLVARPIFARDDVRA